MPKKKRKEKKKGGKRGEKKEKEKELYYWGKSESIENFSFDKVVKKNKKKRIIMHMMEFDQTLVATL